MLEFVYVLCVKQVYNRTLSVPTCHRQKQPQHASLVFTNNALINGMKVFDDYKASA